jgi:hypothetical protein
MKLKLFIRLTRARRRERPCLQHALRMRYLMKAIELIMPLILIVLAFLLKLFIDRTVTAPDALAALLDLPADIAFFSISLIVSFTIAAPSNRDVGMLWFAAYIVMSAFVIFLWRRSLSTFNAGRKFVPAVAGIVNYVITVSMAMHALNLVTGGSNGN